MLKLLIITLISTVSLFGLPYNVHNEQHCVEGNKNAKTKFLVFAVPECPFSMDFLPDIINFVKKNSQDFTLYYYNLPLARFYQNASHISTKAMIVAKKNSTKDVVLKAYEYVFEVTNEPISVILEQFNSIFKADIAPKDLEQKWVVDELQNDLDIVHGLKSNQHQLFL